MYTSLLWCDFGHGFFGPWRAKSLHSPISLMQFCSTILAREESAPLFTGLGRFRTLTTAPQTGIFCSENSIEQFRSVQPTYHNPGLLPETRTTRLVAAPNFLCCSRILK